MTLTAGDAANKNQFAMAGGELVVVRNAGSVNRNVTFLSVADAYGRSKDFTEAVTPGQQKMYGPFLIGGWRQADGNFYLDPEHADVQIAVISLP